MVTMSQTASELSDRMVLPAPPTSEDAKGQSWWQWRHSVNKQLDALGKDIQILQAAASDGCRDLVFFDDISFPIVVLDDNSGFPSSTMSFTPTDGTGTIFVPAESRCVELEIITAVETIDPLVGTVSAGIEILNTVGGPTNVLYSQKAIGRVGMEDFTNENTAQVTVPLGNDGKIHYQFLNLYPAGSSSNTLTGVVVSVLGYYE